MAIRTSAILNVLCLITGILLLPDRISMSIIDVAFRMIKLIDIQTWISLTRTYNVFHASLYNVAAFYLTTIITIVFVFKIYPKNVKNNIDIGIFWPQWRMPTVLVYVAFPFLLVAIEICVIILSWIFSYTLPAQADSVDTSYWVTQILYFSIAIPIKEELVWRYYGLNSMNGAGVNKKLSYTAIVILFSLFHGTYNDGIVSVIIIFPLAATLTAMPFVTRTVIQAIIFHVIYNVAEVRIFTRHIIHTCFHLVY